MMRGGCLLILVSIAAMCVIVVLPVLPFLEENTTIDNYLQPILCQPGETIERSQYSSASSRGGTSYSMDVYCHSDGDRRDVTGNWILIGMAGFALPFTIGLIAVIGGAQRAARRQLTDLASSGRLMVGGQAFPGVMPSAPTPSANVSRLTQRLKELEEARDAGLITEDEYNRLRQEILDSQV